MCFQSFWSITSNWHLTLWFPIKQAVMKLYEVHCGSFSAEHISIILEILSSITSHASEVNSETNLQLKLERACFLLETTHPPIVHFENESYQIYLRLLDTLFKTSSLSEELGIESQLVAVCVKILQIYLKCARDQPKQQSANSHPTIHWILPLGSAKKEELAARTPILVLALKVLSSLGREPFRRNLPCFFPLLVNLVRCEHSSREVQPVLYDIFHNLIGPLILTS